MAENPQTGVGGAEGPDTDLIADVLAGMLKAGYKVREMRVVHLTGGTYALQVDDADQAYPEEEVYIELDPPTDTQ